MTKGKEILRGVAASPGVAVVTVRVVNHDPAKIAAIKAGEVMVAERTEPEHEPYMAKAGAIVTDLGGKTSHAAVTAKRLGIPAVTATGDATTVLKDGQRVVVDGKAGMEPDPVHPGEMRPYGAVYEYIEEAPATTLSAVAAKMAEKFKEMGITPPPGFLEKYNREG